MKNLVDISIEILYGLVSNGHLYELISKIKEDGIEIQKFLMI